MKQKLIMMLVAAVSLLAVTQVEANIGVERTANTWLLTPASWHPGTPNKLYENYPFDLGEKKINMGDEDQPRHFDNDNNLHPLMDKSVHSPVYQQQ